MSQPNAGNPLYYILSTNTSTPANSQSPVAVQQA